MFKKLAKRFQGKESKHPFGTPENLDQLIEKLTTGDVSHELVDVDDWLVAMEDHLAQVGAAAAIAATLRLDLLARPGADLLLENYLCPNSREYLSETVWLALEHHSRHLQSACRVCLSIAPEKDESTSARNRRARLLAVGLRSWAVHKKVLRFRYRVTDSKYWRDGHELLKADAGRLNYDLIRVQRSEPDTTAMHEYLVGLYFELLPWGNFLPQQLEAVDRFLQRQKLEIAAQASPESNYCIDMEAPNGPQRHGKNTFAGGTGMRYFSTKRLRAAALRSAVDFAKGGHYPEWLGGLTITPEDAIAAMNLLAVHWAPTPPKRECERNAAATHLLVVFGYALARRMVAYSRLARERISLNYQSTDFNHLFELRFGGRVGADHTPVSKEALPEESLDPLEILQQLELAGDKAQMETWRQIDVSKTGIGASPPNFRARHRIGAMIAYREEAKFEWRLAIIRRLGRAKVDGHTGRPSVGLETMPWPSLCALARQVGAENAGDGNLWGDAILVKKDVPQIILPAEHFVAQREFDVRSHEGLWRIRLVKLIERGVDFDHIEFERVS